MYEVGLILKLNSNQNRKTSTIKYGRVKFKKGWNSKLVNHAFKLRKKNHFMNHNCILVNLNINMKFAYQIFQIRSN